MSIRPVDLNGVTMRTQDISTLKQNEDNKPFLQQAEIEVEHDKKEARQTRQVHEAEDANRKDSKFDAKEKGSNSYEQLYGPKKKAKKKENEGKVVEKKEHMSFDIRI